MSKDSKAPVSTDEEVLRRIPRVYYNSSFSTPVQVNAFRPTDQDIDGISVFRQACGATPEALVASGRSASGYVVAILKVQEILDIKVDGIRPTVVATPKSDDTVPGHASIPELSIQLKTSNKAVCLKLQQQLAFLACKSVIEVPPPGA